MDKRRDELINELSTCGLGYHPSGEYYCVKSELVADFIIQRENAMLAEIEKPLKDAYPIARAFGRYDCLWNGLNKCLSTINRIREGK